MTNNMANFQEAYNNTMIYEGGYADDPDDKGGETYCGIARKFWSNWEGWRLIDLAKDEDQLTNADVHADLQEKVRDFYFAEFWKPVAGDKLEDQELAEELFDNAVNMSVPKSVEFLQRSLNILNRNEKLYKNIKVDCAMGPATLEAVRRCMLANKKNRLNDVINLYQGKHYIELMEKNETQEKFIGWFERVKLTA